MRRPTSRRSIPVAAAMVLALAAGPSLAAQASAKQVRELMDLFGTDRMFQQMNAQMAAVMGKQFPCVPASYWDDFVDAQAMQDLSDKLVPVYQRHFTAQDVAGLLKFYRSPLGRKLLVEQPSMMTEIMQTGRQWGEQRAAAMMAELQKRGTISAQGQCPASAAPVQPAAPGGK